jgi:enoyl-CoA hydratase/carnithine racemase
MMDNVLTEIGDRTLTIRLNRPEKRNALTRTMYSCLADAFERAEADASIRVVVLTGSADCFTAGNDLSDGIIEGPTGRMAGCSKPIIAAPCGIAVGIGVTMLLHCDLVYCGSHTNFRIPFVPLAVCPECASSYLLPRLVGHHRASEILLTGEAFDATTALELGIVNGVFPNDQVEEIAKAKAALIAAQPPTSVRTTKMLMKRSMAEGVREAIKVEIEHLVRLQHGAEAIEAVNAFKEKRRADFSRFT